MVFAERGRTREAARSIQFVSDDDQSQGTRRGGCPHRWMASVAGAFAELDGNVHLLTAAIDSDVHRVARALAIEDDVDIELPRDLLAVDGDDDIAADVNAAHAGLYQAITAANPRSGGGAAGGGDFNEQAFLNRQVQRFPEPAANRQGLHTKEGAMNAAVG